jgi:hypothetical protein
MEEEVVVVLVLLVVMQHFLMQVQHQWVVQVEQVYNLL